jgi:hypothetical protein
LPVNSSVKKSGGISVADGRGLSVADGMGLGVREGIGVLTGWVGLGMGVAAVEKGAHARMLKRIDSMPIESRANGLGCKFILSSYKRIIASSIARRLEFHSRNTSVLLE